MSRASAPAHLDHVLPLPPNPASLDDDQLPLVIVSEGADAGDVCAVGQHHHSAPPTVEAMIKGLKKMREPLQLGTSAPRVLAGIIRGVRKPRRVGDDPIPTSLRVLLTCTPHRL